MTSLLDDLRKNNFIDISLRGLAAVLKREMGLDNLSYTFTDSFKQELKRQADKNDLGDDQAAMPKATQYPFGYLQVSEIAITRDRTPYKNIRRHGWRMGTADATYSGVSKAYLFPCVVSVELHYYVSDPGEAFLVSQVLAMLSGASSFNFDITIGGEGGLTFNNKLAFIENVSVPIADSENPQAPGAIELTLPMMFETHTGFVRTVAAVNSDRPTITSFAVTTGRRPDNGGLPADDEYQIVAEYTSEG